MTASLICTFDIVTDIINYDSDCFSNSLGCFTKSGVELHLWSSSSAFGSMPQRRKNCSFGSSDIGGWGFQLRYRRNFDPLKMLKYVHKKVNNK